MYGLLGLMAEDPLRSSIAVLALLMLLAIARCLRRLAFFPEKQRDRGNQPSRPSRR